MAQREEGGWPLGLQPLSGRVGGGLVVRNRNRENSGSVSFSTLLTGSPSSSTDLSSDIDSESTGSFFRDRSMTLGSLMGATSILELSRRSSRFRASEASLRDKKSHQHHKHSKPWLLSLCSRLSTDAVRIDTAPSLGYFLEAERRASITYRKNNNQPPVSDPNPTTPISSEVNQTAPQTGSVSLVAYPLRKHQTGRMTEQDSGYGVPLLLSCLRGQIIG
ncbi:uncharacterized protein LOC116208373 [Punica granatum]|uniref:Uncharacterized protein LOC116208373 n=1 Tax=Punica granatum TaxID=22663 RepID=A0A6P8DJU9_PUNGR|nr:uncharacterized protein LOC116208373 [Punica granatum]